MTARGHGRGTAPSRAAALPAVRAPIAALGGFAGVQILVRPGSAVFHPATGLLVMAAIANALYQLLTRKLPGDSAHTTLFYSGIVGTALLSVALPFVETPGELAMRDAAFFIVLGLLAGLGHGLLIAFRA
jgi:hypothetical protein